MKISKMVAKKNAKSATTKKKRAGSSIASYWLIAYAGATLILFGVAALGNRWITPPAGEATMHLAQVYAQGLADRLQDRVGRYRELLEWLAQSPQYAAVPATDRAVALPDLRFPGGEAVRLFPLDLATIDPADAPEISYASLALLRQAAAGGGIPPAEVHGYGTESAHVALAALLRAGDGSEMGLLHLAIPFARFEQAASEIDRTSGRIALQQLVPGRSSLTLTENRPAAGSDGSPLGTYPVGDSIWRVAYWPTTPAQSLDFQTAFWALMLAIWLLLGLWLSLQGKRQRSAIRSDVRQVASLLRAARSEAPSSGAVARVSELAALLDAAKGRPAGTPAGSGYAKVAPVDRDGQSASWRSDPEGVEAGEEPADPIPSLRADIFRAYDIRGKVNQGLNEEALYWIGRAVGSLAGEQGRQTVILARDGRNSSAALAQALGRGLQESGRDVVDLGMVPTPVLYFATHYLGTDCGAMVTGSHNPPEYNGVKLVIAGEAVFGDELKALHRRIESRDLQSGEGSYRTQDLVPDYIGRVADDVHLARPFRLVVDGGNGSAGPVALDLFRELGCEVFELFCDVDGDFPHHHPDPNQPQNLEALIQEVQAQQADLGIAFDGDGDRIGVVDSAGNIIWPDRLLMLLAADVLSRQPGADIVYDVKCSHHLGEHIRAHSGRPVLWKTGHALLKAKVRETAAPLGGEFSGHIVYAERWYGFDDALYAAGRLLEILSVDPRSTAEVFAELPNAVSTPELALEMAEGKAHRLMQEILSQAEFPDASLNRIDGLRADFPLGWGLVRASNTTPALVFRFEADTEQALAEIEEKFRTALWQIRPGLKLPF